MTLRNKQAGFSHVEIFIVVAVIAVLAFVGYRVMNNGKDETDTATNSSQETPAISDKDDLSKAVEDLKSTDTSTQDDENSLQQMVE